MVNRRSVQDALRLHAWTNDIAGQLDTDELAQFVRLWDILIEIHLEPGYEDKPIWSWNREGVYTASSAYTMLCMGGIRFQAYAGIWKCWAPLVCKLFMWLAVQYRLWTSDKRARHVLQDQASKCYMCDQEEDTVDHILL